MPERIPPFSLKKEETQMNDIILKVDHLSKYFALVKALDDISFDVRRGEVHALCGEKWSRQVNIYKITDGCL